MFINNTGDLQKLRINMNAFKNDYMANGGGSFILNMKGGGTAETENLTAKEFMDHYLPLLKGGYKKTTKKTRKGNKKTGGDSSNVEAADAANNFFHYVSPNNMNILNERSYPDLTFNSYSFPDANLPAYR